MDLLGAINRLPKAEQTAAIKNYFGSESLSTIAVLTNNLSNLKDQFDKVGDSSKYAGSMQGEYEARAATTENSIQLMKNSLNALKIQLGTYLLPIVGKGAELLKTVIDLIGRGINKVGPQIKTFVGGITKILGGLTAFISGVFTGNWKKAWKGIKNIFWGIVKSLGVILKRPINSIINQVNTFISGINGVTSNLPDWVPLVGGGANIPLIPALARGGIVTKPTLAMVGEGREPEVVSPLSKLKKFAPGGGQSIVFSPVINVSGGGNVKAQVIEAMRLSYEEFKAMMQRYERERQRLSFA